MLVWEVIEKGSLKQGLFRLEGGLLTATERARVHGGWLVRTLVREQAKNISLSVSMIFVPDLEHDWEMSAHIEEKPLLPVDEGEA
jgi:hypothetical protein